MKLITGNFTGLRKAGVGLFQPMFKQLKNLRFCLDSREGGNDGKKKLGIVFLDFAFAGVSSSKGRWNKYTLILKPDRYISTRFKASGLFCVSKIVKNSFLVIWCTMALSLNTSCTSSSDGDHFNQEEGRTTHDIRKFLLSVSAELQMESEKGESHGGSGVTSVPITGASDSSSGELKQVDWTQAHLTEKHLKKLAALRIKTVSKGEPVKNSTSQVGVLEDTYSRVPFNTQYYRLDYEFLDVNLPPQTSMDSIKEDQEKLWAFLLGRDIENFYGFPDTVYYILPHVESNYLILYRLGLPDTIPYDQLPLARRVGDFLATPLVGYPVQYCLPEKDKNEYGETTDQSTPNCEGIPLDSAKHVKFETDKEHKKPFEYEEKLDLFPADFFSGDWFYLRTKIQSNKIINNREISDPSFQTAHLVEFQKKSNHLAVMDSSQYGLDEKDRNPILFIPVKWKEYEMNRDLNFFNNFEEREKKPARRDAERPYFLLDFQELKSFEQSYSSTIHTVKNVLVTEDFVSFNIETNRKGGSSTVVKYSFRRAVDNPDYPQKQWYEQDSSTFHPVSYIEQKHYVTPLHYIKADREQFYRATRFDPNKEEIRWYFSTQTPQDDWVRDFGRQAIAYENRVFQEAGKHSPRKIQAVLDEEGGDKELGDTRYNIINLVVTETSEPTAFGVGSHVAHPVTGEIVSATVNVWVSHIVDKQYVPIVRQYIRFHIWPLPWKLLPSSPGVSDFLHGKIQKLCPDVMKFIANSQGVVSPLHPINSRDVLNDGDLQVQCARKLARTHILYEVMQAVRHGHGFRHVLSASADAEHYYQSYDEIKDLFGDVEKIHNSPSPSWEDDLTENQEKPPYYSSVMDYAYPEFPALSVPGKYDIAATRYLYFDQLETTDDKGVVDGFITLDSGDKSIKQEITEGPVLFTDLDSNQSRKKIDESQVKTYYVCGGKNQIWSRPDEHHKDPFCAIWDYGRTPKEVVTNQIRNLKDDLMLYSRRYDSDKLNPVYHFSDPKRLEKFTQRWSELRNQVLEAAGKKITDFSSFIDSDIEEYKRIIAEAIKREKARYQLQMTEAEKAKCQKNMSSSASGTAPSECVPYSDLETYYEIVPLLADLYQELLFIPHKQCIYQKKVGSTVSYQAVALEVVKARIKSTYPEGSREVLINCQSEIFKKWAEQRNLGRFIAEVGGFSNIPVHEKYFIQPTADDPIDEYSMNQLYTSVLAAMRFVLMEPDVRQVFFQGVRDFWLKGYDLNPYLDEASLRGSLGLSADEALPRLPRFSSHEITTLIPTAKQYQLQIMGQLEVVQNIMEEGSRLDKIRWQVQVHHDLIAESDPSGLHFQLSQLIGDNPDQAKLQMSIAYREHWPFMYQAYQKYLTEYGDTYDGGASQQKQVPSFPQFFVNLPSVLSLFSVGGDTFVCSL